MSWMDSWSRPSKHAAVPPPLYLTAGEDVPYCHTCGRVMSSRKSTKPTKSNPNNIVKYCSDRCRSRKPGPIDKKIERTIIALLNAEENSGLESTGAKTRVVKGDHRIIVTCDEIEELVFGSRFDPEKVYGRRKRRATRVIGAKGKGGDGEWKSVDMESSTEDDDDHSEDEDEDEDEDGNEDGGTKIIPGLASSPGAGAAAGAATATSTAGPRIRPPQTESDVNFSVGGERGWAERTEESQADLEKKVEGQKRAEEREMVRRAARRGVVFGFLVDGSSVDQQQQQQSQQQQHGSKKSKHSKKDKEKEERENQGKSEDESRDDGKIRRKCEALMNGSLVEPSFAKGNWSIRWRE